MGSTLCLLHRLRPELNPVSVGKAADAGKTAAGFLLKLSFFIGILNGKMANSNVTKRMLADSLKELVLEIPLEKITIADICQRNGMNRKSFYYHFRDKYDLLKHIFQTEFLQENSLEEAKGHNHMYSLCGYLYKNQEFYRHVLRPHQHNYFRQYFYETIQEFVKQSIEMILNWEKQDEFHIVFLTDGLVGSIEHWIMDYKPIPPEEFVGKIFFLLESIGRRVYQEQKGQQD